MKKIKIRLLILTLVLILIISAISIVLIKNNVLATEGECAICGGTGKVSGRCEGGYTSTCSKCNGNLYVAHTGVYASYDSTKSMNCSVCGKTRNSKIL